MTKSIKHHLVSAVPDDSAAALAGEVVPSDWNAEHDVSGIADAVHTHAGEDITSGTVADGRVASTLARDSEVTTAIGTHEAAGDPHPGYLTPAEGTAAYEATGAVATHAGLTDPHTGYRLESADHSHASTGLQGGTIAYSVITGTPAAERAASSTTPAAVGTAAVGTGTTDARSDHVHATGAGTPSTQAIGDAAATGTGPAASMTDHKHAMPAFGTGPAAVGTQANGSSANIARIDHVHATGAGTPSTQAFGDAAATGTGPAAAMTDHKHAMPALPAIDATAAATDITTRNVSTSAHGLAPKLPNDATKYLDGTGAYSVPAGSGSTVNAATCQGRLTLTTAVPVTTTDVTAATTLYFTPYGGNLIGTYSGSAWSVNAFTEKSITLATLTAGLPYDVFIVDSTLALELLAWTNATTRATALVTQDGILSKTGALTRRYLGTICIVATGQSEDSVARRMVWNYYNRVERSLYVTDSTDSWNYSTATWRAANNTLTNHQVEFVCGVAEDAVDANLLVRGGFSSGVAGSVGLGLSSTSAPATGSTFFDYSSGATESVGLSADLHQIPAIGYGYISWLEYTRASTITFYGDSGIPTSNKSAISASVRA